MFVAVESSEVTVQDYRYYLSFVIPAGKFPFRTREYSDFRRLLNYYARKARSLSYRPPFVSYRCGYRGGIFTFDSVNFSTASFVVNDIFRLVYGKDDERAYDTLPSSLILRLYADIDSVREARILDGRSVFVHHSR